jgi:hypothetical protein
MTRIGPPKIFSHYDKLGLMIEETGSGSIPLVDTDPGGPKTYGSGTLLFKFDAMLPFLRVEYEHLIVHHVDDILVGARTLALILRPKSNNRKFKFQISK